MLLVNGMVKLPVMLRRTAKFTTAISTTAKFTTAMLLIIVVDGGLVEVSVVVVRVRVHVIGVGRRRGTSIARRAARRRRGPGRARCRGCKRLIAKGETRIVITAFVLPGRATVFSRCGRCLGTRFATAVLDVCGTADRVPREPGLTDREAARVCARLSDAAQFRASIS